MKENWLKIFLKGLCVGGTMLVPGVSGGSMAMILYIRQTHHFGEFLFCL